MTFSEYFNALYPYLSGGEKPLDFFDGMIGYFIYEEAQEACTLLNCRPDTKKRYIKKSKPNNIKPQYAQYAYSKHSPQRYQHWLKDRMFKQDTFDKIEEWLNANDVESSDVCAACDGLLENIFLNIAYPEGLGGSDIKLPEKNAEETSDSSRLTEKDRKLLKDFHFDFDGILEKFIMNGQNDVLLAGDLSPKIDELYNGKWKNLTASFESIAIQSEILKTIATLKELCAALDLDSESSPGTSVRRLRAKLRNSYVRLHPDDYVNIFPYEAFVDDWNDGEEYEF